MAVRLFVVLLLASALPAHAELYKWIDKNGIVNYTDAPPPDAKNNAVEKLTDRASHYQPDARTQAASANRGPSYYELQLEREWAQRQRLIAAANMQAQPCASAYSMNCYETDPRYGGYAAPYGPAVIVARPVQPVAFRPHRPIRP